MVLSKLRKLFKTKSEKDIKKLVPYVEKIKEESNQIESLSHDELRAKTQELKQYIQDNIQYINDDIKQLENDVESDNISINEKTDIFQNIDLKKTERDEKIEEILLEILPVAFAIVKDTARRFTENETLSVVANEQDKDFALEKDFVNIKEGKAIYDTSWLVGGHKLKWNMIHYDVQLTGGIVLHLGKIAEMATGEGKTLVSTLPVFLNALVGFSVHLVTVNDYLAKRDAEWMGPIYEFHGMKVDCIDKHEPHSEGREKAYLADVVYGTNNEFGFDYLRDNMSSTFKELVQQKLHFAIVDEVDSVLIDDARTPLIISGPVPRGDRHEYNELKPVIEKLLQTQKTYLNTALNDAKKFIDAGDDGLETGGLALLRSYRGLPKNKTLIKYLSDPKIKQILTKTENFYMQERNKNMHKVDAELYFVIEERNRQVDLTDKGLHLINSWANDSEFFVMPDISIEIDKIEKEVQDPIEKLRKKDEINKQFVEKSERIHSVQQLLKAYTLFENDVDYVLEGNKVKIVDEQTGRIMEGRRYSDGLHQALEAKENVKIEDATQTYATITLQNYFRMYHKLSGMTGTAITEASEFWQIYKLDVVEIPTNVPVIRKDHEDKVFRTTREKYGSIIDEVVSLVEQKRPVLVGTTSVENSQLVSRMLNMKKIKHQVLNAKLHHKEADIIAEAGNPATVTIATNMAGRGTDIKLSDEVKKSGGLAIVGTEKHESRRVDRQLRGRAGRQGDTGSSQFFVSLEDPLMRIFGSGRISNIMKKMGYKEGEVIQHSMITQSIERAQKKVEGNNFGIRKRLLEYDDVMNAQRTAIYEKRRNSMQGKKLKVDLHNIFYDSIEAIVYEAYSTVDFAYLKNTLSLDFSVNINYEEEELKSMNKESLVKELFEKVVAQLNTKNETVGKLIYNYIILNYSGQTFTNERIQIPFTDGIKVVNVNANIEKILDTKGLEVVNACEKNVTLSIIDENWKDHLRKMDDLRQSVQNTVYEQKDPLLIYKFEAFELFKELLTKMNREIVSFLMKGYVPIPQSDSTFEQANTVKTDFTNVQNIKQDYTQNFTNTTPEQSKDYNSPQAPKPITPHMRSNPKIGRNDLCPCGSGKKYKNCHALKQGATL